MLNKFLFTGRLTDNATLKNTSKNVLVTTFSIANNEKVKDKDITTFLPVTFFPKSTKQMELLAKGNLVTVEGHFATSQFTDQSGKNQVRTEFIVDKFDLLARVKTVEPKNEFVSADSYQDDYVPAMPEYMEDDESVELFNPIED